MNKEMCFFSGRNDVDDDAFSKMITRFDNICLRYVGYVFYSLNMFSRAGSSVMKESVEAIPFGPMMNVDVQG